LLSNRRWLARQFAAHLIHRFPKRLFPTEINQGADNKYFGKRAHGKATFSKSRPQRKLSLTQPNLPASDLSLTLRRWRGSILP
jgi:hypothetical protein